MNALALNSLALTRPARLRATTKANGTYMMRDTVNP